MPNQHEKNPATNVLYNEQAMAILKDARERLSAMGLYCGLSPTAMSPESDVSVALFVATSEQALEETIVGSLVASESTGTVSGLQAFNERLFEFRSDRALIDQQGSSAG